MLNKTFNCPFSLIINYKIYICIYIYITTYICRDTKTFTSKEYPEAKQISWAATFGECVSVRNQDTVFQVKN